ncbi:hypothetical protein HG535_0G01950 [Zygotorulaspora mrakii]|uniref:Uncharacterized protein n=1 Tax=Zygotorulaspora mrakii TaxID=42260 RepID=A0A7H9B6K1_ZYGMR|nr:uncharacterized protein HG535_0G01950 [Zygotorulaspora mrakii]QLG74311.1 hypothetical protein HG535_0G01950 [Zygotorulaspora mrakii]
MSDLDNVLVTINDSLRGTLESLEKLQTVYRSEGEDNETKTKTIKSQFWKNNEDNHKVSLLSLKNASMMAYVNSLLLVIGQKLDKNCTDPSASESRKMSIQHRVVLERGVKPLEKKLSYQLDKLTRAYTRMEKEYLEAEKVAIERSQYNSQFGRNEEEDEDDSSDEDMSHRPNLSGVMQNRQSSKQRSVAEVDTNEEEQEDENKDSIYRPPKISAVLPPQRSSHFEDKFNAQEHKDRSGKSRMQAMEEYIRESSEKPDWEASIGTNIVNHGKGGIKSLRDTERENKVAQYEEENFTRLNVGTSKIDKRRQKERERMAHVNMIGGEDFSIFNSKRKLQDSTSRKSNKKPHNAWDRAKNRL